MCEIITFRKCESPRRASPQTPRRDAEILFFTGVRYMRYDDYTAPTGAPASHGGESATGKKRKRRARA